MIEAEKEFYKNLQDFTEPAKTDKDYIKRNDVAWRDASLKYIGLLSMYKQLEEQLSEARETLLTLAEDSSCVGCGVKVIKSSRKGNVQYSKIPELQHVDLDYYRSPPIEQWKILTTGEENA